jgi:hypothetical protein
MDTINTRNAFSKFVTPILLMLALAGCNGQDPGEVTPVNLFPTAIPKGTGLPTFSGGIAPTNPPSIVTNLPPTAPLPTTIPTAIPPTGIPTLDANWLPIADGIVYRRLAFTNSAGQGVGVLVTRIEPAKVTFRVRYVPGQKKTVNEWLVALPGAKVIVNANFFDTSNNPIGLAAVDGAPYGRSTGRADAGLFQVKSNAPHVRSLFLEPYNNTERFDQVVEGFPMLVVQGQSAPAFNSDISTAAARRTIVAQDLQGRILIMVTAPGTATLKDMANWLRVSGLQLDTAVNMDGGNSTLMYLATGGPSSLTQGLVPVPVVIAVYSR